MGVKQEGFEQPLSVLLAGRESKAKELGALTRGRAIKSATDLLRLIFIYLGEGKSFSETASLLHLAGICSIMKKAVYTLGFKNAEHGCNGSVSIFTGTMHCWERRYSGLEAGQLVDASDKADYRLQVCMI